MNIIDAFHQLGSYRAAAPFLGTTHKTVRRAVERQQAGGPWSSERSLPDQVAIVLSQSFQRSQNP